MKCLLYPQWCFYKEKGILFQMTIFSLRLLANQQLEHPWSPTSLCLGNICLVWRISTLYLGQCLNALFPKHTPQIKSYGCLQSDIFTSTLETNEEFPMAVCHLRMYLCKTKGHIKNLVGVTKCFQCCIWILRSWKMELDCTTINEGHERAYLWPKVGGNIKKITQNWVLCCNMTPACFPAKKKKKKSMIAFRSHEDKGNDFCCRKKHTVLWGLWGSWGILCWVRRR